MAYTLEEDHSDAGYNLASGVYGTWYACETFAASGSYDLKRIDLPLCTEGTPPTLYVELWSTSGGEPDSMLKSHTVVAELPVYSSKVWTEFVFTDAQTVVEGTTYAILVKSGGGGDGDNRGRWWIDSSGSWAGASGWSNDSGSNWNMSGTTDFLFKIYSEDPLPGKPTTPYPSDEATGITLHDTSGTWESGGNTDSYNVYYGTLSGFLELVEEGVTGLSLALVEGHFSVYGKISYWRVDAVNTQGTTQGDEWVFTTMSFAPPLPTGYTLDCSEDPPVLTGTPTGVNNMMTIKKLVLAANNKIWYEDI